MREKALSPVVRVSRSTHALYQKKIAAILQAANKGVAAK